ncbi:hypothetical protein ACFX2I_009174 [Malus domestica]
MFPGIWILLGRCYRQKTKVLLWIPPPACLSGKLVANLCLSMRTLRSSSHWSPHPPYLVKLNVDASWKRSPTSGSIGGFPSIVVRNLDDRSIAIR